MTSNVDSMSVGAQVSVTPRMLPEPQTTTRSTEFLPTSLSWSSTCRVGIPMSVLNRVDHFEVIKSMYLRFRMGVPALPEDGTTGFSQTAFNIFNFFSEIKFYVDHQLLWEISEGNTVGMIGHFAQMLICEDALIYEGDSSYGPLQEILGGESINANEEDDRRPHKFDEYHGVHGPFRDVWIDLNYLTTFLFRNAPVGRFGHELGIELTSVNKPPLTMVHRHFCLDLGGCDGSRNQEWLDNWGCRQLAVVMTTEVFHANPSMHPREQPYTHVFQTMVSAKLPCSNYIDGGKTDSYYLGLVFPVKHLITHLVLWSQRHDDTRHINQRNLSPGGRDLMASMTKFELACDGEEYLKLEHPTGKTLRYSSMTMAYQMESLKSLWGRPKCYDANLPLILEVNRGERPTGKDHNERRGHGVPDQGLKRHPNTLGVFVCYYMGAFASWESPHLMAALLYWSMRKIALDARGYASVVNVAN